MRAEQWLVGDGLIAHTQDSAVVLEAVVVRCTLENVPMRALRLYIITLRTHVFRGIPFGDKSEDLFRRRVLPPLLDVCGVVFDPSTTSCFLILRVSARRALSCAL